MRLRSCGSSGLRISEIAFGAGPVPALMTGALGDEAQLRVVQRALEAGINWFDTAATYGEGRSERALGAALNALDAREVHVATKVRVPVERLADVQDYVQESLRESLARLGRPAVTLVQLHNSITVRRGDQPTSITPDDVLGPRGVLAGFEALRRAGCVAHLGLTGLGEPTALCEVLRSRAFATVQVPYHLLNPSAGVGFAPAGAEADYGHLIADCERLGVGVLAIRVLAGGALAGQPPSAHTHTTKFFPLDVYRRDERRAAALARELPAGLSLREAAIRFALSHAGVTSALIGLSTVEQIDEAAEFAARGPLDQDVLLRISRWWRD